MSRAAGATRAPHPLNATEKHMDKEGLLQGKLALVTGAGQGNGRALALDVTDAEACGRRRRRAAACRADRRAGQQRRHPDPRRPGQRAAENWRRVLDVNLNGSFNMIHAFLGMLRTRGVIINVGSIASFAGVGAAWAIRRPRAA